ncbi:nucleotidyltransferase family protein [Pollutibacter soli]|uniref:nucleotidyltransferase family protein n=1 Tax=Pollutibacter soli TaxID=3034157 RepID=UPI003013AA46
MRTDEVVILAGGLGTRLSKTVPGVQKCMAPVNGLPFLYFLIKYLNQYNTKRFILSLGHLHENIQGFVDSHFSGLDVVYSIETFPLGTGGAIKKALGKSESESVIVINGDTFFNVDLHRLKTKFRLAHCDCMIALKPMKDFDRYGTVETSNGKIIAFKEKQRYAEGLINGGIYIMKNDLLASDNFPEVFSFEKDYLEKQIDTDKIYGEVFDEYFIDIGIPEDYYRAQEELRQFI